MLGTTTGVNGHNPPGRPCPTGLCRRRCRPPSRSPSSCRTPSECNRPETPAQFAGFANDALLFGQPVARAPWRTIRDAVADLGEPTRTENGTRFRNHVLQLGARSYAGHTGSPLDEPAKTLKAGDHGVPGGENMIRHPNGNVRYFSVRESCRLQGFPDEYIFEGSWTENMRQLGNAVPVELGAVVLRSVRAALERHNATEKQGLL